MDCRVVLLLCFGVLFVFLITYTEGRTKKVVIHVPYKVKKIKHTHTVYRTIHHHHMHHDHDHIHAAAEEHEHFHHMHMHDEPHGGHSQPVPSIGIPEFLPDVPDLPDVPHDIPGIPKRNVIPLYKRH